MLPIKVLDHGSTGDSPLEYTSAHAKPDLRMKYPVEGTLLARACLSCGRVFWYISRSVNAHRKPDPTESAIALDALASGVFEPIDEE